MIQTSADAGTSDAAPLRPFSVTSLGGDWVSVGSGEAWYNPAIGGELLDIKGMGLPFRVNSQSFIYLMVIFDLSGRPTFSGICHTGKHLRWLLPGEKWLGYPKMHAVDEFLYRGIWTRGDQQSTKPGAKVPGYKYAVGPDDDNIPYGAHGGWFGNKWGGIEGGFQDGYEATDNIDNVGWPRDSLRKRYKEYKDLERTIDVIKGGYNANQVYSGIDRELRKCICSQGTNSHNPYHSKWPWTMKDVGWYPVQKVNPLPYTFRRQKLGYIAQDGTIDPNQRGPYEIGGYMNVAKNIYNHAGLGGPSWGSSWKQEESYRATYRHIERGFLYKTEKLWKTEYDQVMAFYPIAYACQPTRKLEDGFTSGKITVPSFTFEYTDSTGAAAKHVEREFEIRQACKNNLRLATVIEGECRFKILMPFQGMCTQILAGDGSQSNTDLNFVQQWQYHSQKGTQASYYRINGKYRYDREAGPDIPYSTKYINLMFNNQKPPSKGLQQAQ